jgi:hypothetical protein
MHAYCLSACLPASHGRSVTRAALSVDDAADGAAPVEDRAEIVRADAFEVEVRTKLKDTIETEEGREELRSLFVTLDTDGSGAVSSKEWGAAVTANEELMRKYFVTERDWDTDWKAAVGRAFNLVDGDGDKDLTWEEFVASAKSYTPPAPSDDDEEEGEQEVDPLDDAALDDAAEAFLGE